jgi:hypothetical protein
MSRPLTILILEFTFLIASLSCQSAAQISQTAPVSGRSLGSTKLQFPQPWFEATELGSELLSFVQQIEVRKVPNSSDGELFFAALPDGDNDYSHELYKDIPKPKYSQNAFAVNFAVGLRVRAATNQEWESASRVVTKPRRVFPKGRTDSSGDIEYRDKKFPKVGKYWGEGLLSPGGKWLAVFSYTAEKPPPDFFHFLGGGNPRTGDIFWQVYDTVTGEKVFEWQARNVKSPASLKGPVVWLEERYFLFPEDMQAQTFVVVTLPKFIPETNPVTVRLPSGNDDKGARLPAPSWHEIWGPLVALTREEATEITAPWPTEFSEIRLSAQPSPKELLLAIKEETQNRTLNRQQRDGAGEYNYRVVSTYYYAVSLDDPTQTRFASKEEWERGRVVRSGRLQISLDQMMETTAGRRPAYRPFPKTGASWGSPKALSAGEWIAVFSYTHQVQQAGASPAGKMFVDVYESRSGNKLSSVELPYAGSADALFNGALWIEGDYVILPLNTSLDSFLLWNLPGGIS